MTDSEQDPWGIELVPLRTPSERREQPAEPAPPADAPPPPATDAMDVVKVMGQLARTLDRIEIRLLRIERVLKLADPENREDPLLRRLRRETPPDADPPPSQP